MICVYCIFIKNEKQYDDDACWLVQTTDPSLRYVSGRLGSGHSTPSRFPWISLLNCSYQILLSFDKPVAVCGTIKPLGDHK